MNTSQSAIKPGLFRCAGGLIVAVGTAVFLAWWQGIYWLTNLRGFSATMKANTALAFVFCGSSLFLLSFSNHTARRISRFFALFSGCIALISLLEYTTSSQWGFDQWLIADPFSPSVASPHPGRMAPNTGFAFLLTTSALLLISRPSHRASCASSLRILGWLLVTLGSTAVLSQLASLSIGFHWWNLSGMALHTGALFTLLGSVILNFAWRQAGSCWWISRWLTLGFFSAVGVIIAASIYSRQSAQRFTEMARQVQRTHQIIAKTQQLRSSLDEAQSGVRGFVITGDSAFLRITTVATPEGRKAMRELHQLNADNPNREARLAQLDQLIAQWFEYAERVIATRKASGLEAAADLIARGDEKGILDQARKIFREMDLEDSRFLASREIENHSDFPRPFDILPIGTVISVALLTAGLLRLNGEMAARIREREALRESESLFRTMADAIPQLAWMAEPNGSIFWYNQRWYDYTGLQPEILKGWGWQRVHDPSILPKVLQNWSEAIIAQRPFEMDFPLRGADGQFRWFLTRVFPLKNPAGQLVRWFGTNTDVSQKREAEEKIRDLNATLEQRVHQRTEQLELTINELDAFSYSVSHDLRAPLRAIDGFSRLIVDRNQALLDPESCRMLGIVRRETQRMGQLIDDLLTFSRVSRQPLHPLPIEMESMVRSVFEEAAALEPDRKFELELQPLPRAFGTPAMIRQVWVNLIGNAIKFTKGRPIAKISIGSQPGPPNQLIYFIKDNGVGFDLRYVQKLFGVFERLHSEREFQGTGVGLALIQRIVQRHGGQAWADSQLQKGATFYFSLPNSACESFTGNPLG